MSPSASRPVLGLDTATHTASAALVDAHGQLLAEATHDTSGRGDDLLVLLDDLCRAAGVAPRELGAVAVGAGPGSFTGLRIGMATAKGIAFAARCPLWLGSSLAAMAAEAAPAARAAASGASPLVVPVLDARRDEVFCGFYDGGLGTAALGAERVLAPEQLAAAVAEVLATTPDRPVWYCGDALAALPDELAAFAPRWLEVARTPAARELARLALRGDRHDHLTEGRPAYLRPAEAEVMYPDGVPGALRKISAPSG